ncbi:hypothetical protein N7495_008213 [Penicillium taxi]|uniref:uncharacterized protein n=1 Tax=Penicillium taxi TaxID=168475 RepID=UPI002544DB7D|nr:uncharacterized protein N7495_008213 [Penicillium taxi]KAJ5888172.1 hypothetical protein N7495_008213 [Penicillium taxi]
MVFNNLGMRALEIWLINRLLRSSAFHQMVGRVHQYVQHVRHGVPLEQSRTSLDNPGTRTKFLEYFKEELKDQMKGKPPNKL